MQIYTGNAMGTKLEQVKEHGCGIMIASSATCLPRKDFAQVPCALDNGAFGAYRKGYPFIESVFLRTMEKCYELGLTLDFIVCPDMVAGGERSLEFSMRWATGRLSTCPRLSLVVQDGMTEEMLDNYVLSHFALLFVGGTVQWKWDTAQKWVRFAHAHGKKCHIGQVGQARYLKHARHIQADSVDSTSLVRNGSWRHVTELNHPLLADSLREMNDEKRTRKQ